MKNRYIKILSAVLSLLLLVGGISGAGAVAIGLESASFTSKELREIYSSEQTINDYLSNRIVPFSSYSKVLPMTPIQQQNSYYCGPATACMIAATLNLKKGNNANYTQNEMASIVGTTTSGSSSSGLASGLNSLLSAAGRTERYQQTNTSYSSLSGSLIYSIDKGIPLIINVKTMPNYSVSVGHFIAGNGYYVGVSGSSATSTINIRDSHPSYYGSYIYDISTIINACNSAVGNFCRLQ